MLNLDGSFSTSTTGYAGPEPTLEDIQAGMLLAKQLMERSSTLLKIWRGEGASKACVGDDSKRYPRIIYSEYMRDNMLVIMAGIGIIAGAVAYKIVRNMDLVLQWSDEYIPLEDQPSQAAQMLLKWAEENKDGG
jgi:hypothetical protein